MPSYGVLAHLQPSGGEIAVIPLGALTLTGFAPTVDAIADVTGTFIPEKQPPEVFIKRRKLRKRKKEEIIKEIVKAKAIPQARLTKPPIVTPSKGAIDVVALGKTKEKFVNILFDLATQEEAFRSAILLLDEREKRIAEQEIAFIQQQEQLLGQTLRAINLELQQGEDEELLMLLL